MSGRPQPIHWIILLLCGAALSLALSAATCAPAPIVASMGSQDTTLSSLSAAPRVARTAAEDVEPSYRPRSNQLAYGWASDGDALTFRVISEACGARQDAPRATIWVCEDQGPH